MILSEDNIDELEDNILINELAKYKDIILFGAGRSGDYFFDLLVKNQIHPKCYCDNFISKQNTIKNGINIYSFENSIKMYPNAAICITSVFCDEIYKQIKKFDEGLSNQIYFVMKTMAWETDNISIKSREKEWIRENINNLNWFYDMLSDDISKETLQAILNFRLTRKFDYLDLIYCKEETYFDKTLFGNAKRYKVFLDGGSYTGDTLKSYLDFVNYNYDRIICFEPDVNCFNYLTETVHKLNCKNVELYNKALWNMKTKVNFYDVSACGGTVREESSSGINVETEFVDNLSLNKLDFVKLDIEGAEFNAILGMKETIKRCKPTLAISVYHKQDDFIVLPSLIMQISSDYKFYLRHYMRVPFETVLYAIPDN